MRLIDISLDYPFHSVLERIGRVIGYCYCENNGGWNIVLEINFEGNIFVYNPYVSSFYDAQRNEIEEIYV